jgi:LacI family transcriptional regulator
MSGRSDAIESRVTIRSIAEATGLSIATVSRALQESPAVRPDTIRTVLSAADKLGYRRNPAGAGLRTGRTEMICLTMPIARPGDMIGDVGALHLITGANDRLAGSGYNLNLVPYAIHDDPVEALARVVRRGNFDGVTISLTRPQDERLEFLVRHNIPFVTFGRTESAIPHAFYDVDNDDFVYRATRFLIARGCRRPVLVTPPPEYLFSRHRRTGFTRALGEAGLPFHERRSVVTESNDLAFAAFVNHAAHGGERPDGYVCGGEISALAVIRELEKAGQVVGRDVHLVTMETSDLPSLFAVPVTGFFQDLHRAGAVLADFLLRRIAGEPPEDLQLVETMSFRDRS